MALNESMEEGRERRRHERIPKEVNVHFGVFTDLTDINIDREGTLLDLGAGGVRILTQQYVEVASQIMLVLEFPGWAEGAFNWQVTADKSEIGVLKVVGMVIRCLPSSIEPGFYETAVCFCGRMKK